MFENDENFRFRAIEIKERVRSVASRLNKFIDNEIQLG